MDKKNGNRKRKGNTREKIRRGGHKQKISKTERGGFKKKRRRVLRLRETIAMVDLVETWVEKWSWEKTKELLPKEYKLMGMPRSKMRKEERNNCWGNNNRGEIGD
jgi:hypothetical protein